MFPKPPIDQCEHNSEPYTCNIRYPVVDVGAAVEAGLYEFNCAAEGARADEDWQQADAARARQWEGECGEGDEVYELVAALRRRWWRLQGPEHRDCQGDCHDYGEGDVEVLAHPQACIWGGAQRQARA